MLFLLTTFNQRADRKVGKGTEWICDHPDVVSNIISVTYKCETSVKSFIDSDSQFSHSGDLVKYI